MRLLLRLFPPYHAWAAISFSLQTVHCFKPDGVISVAAALPNYAVFTTGSLEMNCYLVIAASPWNVPNLTEESQNSLVYGNFGARISKDLFYLAQVACTIASHSHCFWEKSPTVTEK